MLANPVYAGAYVYGKNRQETVLDDTGARRKRIRKLPMEDWQVLIKDHHKGYIDWPTFEANQQRMATNAHPRPHAEAARPGGAVREGGALLQGIARCGHCGRRLRTHYRGRNATPGYHCAGQVIAAGRGVYCLNVGGVQIDDAVVAAFLDALEPARLAATLQAAERLENDREAALKQWRLDVERAQFAVDRAERRYRAVDPDNRLVARRLEQEWEEALRAVEAAKAELTRREGMRPRVLSARERETLIALGADLASVWHAPTTTARDRKELLRTLIEEATLHVDRDKAAAQIALRWKGGALSHLIVALPRSRPATVRTDGHAGAAAATGAALPRRRHRRHSQPPGPPNGLSPPVRRQPRRQSAPLLEDPRLQRQVTGRRRRHRHRPSGGRRTRRGALDTPPPPQRRPHPGRTDHAWRTMAHSPDHGPQGPLPRHAQRRLRTHPRRD